MRAIFILAVLVTRLGFAANGDIVSCTVDTNGWSMLIAVAGVSSNTPNWNFGITTPLGTNANYLPACQVSIPTNPTVVVTAMSPGFDDNGNPIAVTRQVYGTIYVRQAYPNAASYDQEPGSGIMTNRIALSDYVFAGDTNVTIVVATNWYNDGTVYSHPTNMSVLNNSIAQHQRVIANWSWPPGQLITTTQETVRAIAYHYSGQFGRPVRVMKFFASDQHSHWVTNTVTNMVIDRTIPDANFIQEYVATLPLGSFTSGDRVTNYWTAYPWIGDTNAVTTCADGTNSPASPLYCPQVCVYVTNNFWGIATAVVDPTNGNDSTGVCVTNFAPGASVHPYLDIGTAGAALMASNLIWFGHKDVGGSTIYLTNGVHPWIGASLACGTNAFCYVNIFAYPGLTASSCIVSNQSGYGSLAGYQHLKGLTINGTSGNIFQGSGCYYWFDQCTINSTAAAMVYDANGWWVTDCTVPALSQGFITPSSKNDPCMLVRGNNLTSFTGGGGAQTYVVVGNTATGTSGNQAIWADSSLRPTPEPYGVIFAYNTFYGFNAASVPYSVNITKTNIYGKAFGTAYVQNIFEGVLNSATSPTMYFSGDSAQDTNTYNGLLWNNVIVGQRINNCYDEYGATNAHWKIGFSEVGNIWSAWNIKTDTFTGQAPSGVRVGNWSSLYGVGYYNNFHININGQGGFIGEYCGLFSFCPWTIESGIGQPTSTVYAYNYVGFMNNGAYTGFAGGSGAGNYRLTSTNYASAFTTANYRFPQMWKLPYDISGSPRGMYDYAGAYTDGQPRRGTGVGF